MGISGDSRVADEEIEEAALKDKDYTMPRQLVKEGKQHEVKGEHKRVTGELNTDGSLMIRGKNNCCAKRGQ